MADMSLEGRYLHRTLELLDLRPDGQIQSSETPDFLVQLRDETVGIEVTSFYLPESGVSQSHQARVGCGESQLSRRGVNFVRRAVQRFTLLSSSYQTDRYRRGELTSLGPILAHAIAATRLPTSIHDPSVRVDIRLLPLEVAFISVSGSVNATDEIWYCAISG